MGMSAKEYDVQRTDKALRFRIIRHDDVPHQLRDGCCPLQPTKHGCWRDCRYAIVEFNGEKPVRVVGSDGGEPEDQLLVRDWSWVWVEMNKLAAQIADRDAKLIAFAKTDAGTQAEDTELGSSHINHASSIPPSLKLRSPSTDTFAPPGGSRTLPVRAARRSFALLLLLFGR